MEPGTLRGYSAFDIGGVSDLPLFGDTLLLFNSEEMGRVDPSPRGQIRKDHIDGPGCSGHTDRSGGLGLQSRSGWPGRHPAEIKPAAMSGVLISMLVNVSAHRRGLEEWGVSADDLQVAMARIIFWAISGQKPRDDHAPAARTRSAGGS